MGDDIGLEDIELLPVHITNHIRHSWSQIEDHLKQAGNILYKR